MILCLGQAPNANSAQFSKIHCTWMKTTPTIGRSINPAELRVCTTVWSPPPILHPSSPGRPPTGVASG